MKNNIIIKDHRKVKEILSSSEFKSNRGFLQIGLPEILYSEEYEALKRNYAGWPMYSDPPEHRPNRKSAIAIITRAIAEKDRWSSLAQDVFISLNRLDNITPAKIISALHPVHSTIFSIPATVYNGLYKNGSIIRAYLTGLGEIQTSIQEAEVAAKNIEEIIIENLSHFNKDGCTRKNRPGVWTNLISDTLEPISEIIHSLESISDEVFFKLWLEDGVNKLLSSVEPPFPTINRLLPQEKTQIQCHLYEAINNEPMSIFGYGIHRCAGQGIALTLLRCYAMARICRL